MCVCANAGHRCDLARLPWGARVVIKLAPVPTEMLLQWQGSNDLATDRVAAGAYVEHQAYRRSLLARTLLGWRPMGLLADHRRSSHHTAHGRGCPSGGGEGKRLAQRECP
jgi:hypothetical protein